MRNTTVYFVTNRAPGPDTAAAPDRFGAAMIPMENRQLSWGAGFVTGSDPSPSKLTTGTLADVNNVAPDLFSQSVQDDILGSGKPLLIFLHGFANSFSDALTRAAFNREWFADSGLPDADCTAIAFTWPSAGRVVNGKDALPGIISIGQTIMGFLLHQGVKNPLATAYLTDQQSARSSGRDFARTLDRLAPLFAKVRAKGRKVHLLVHSMGHVVLQAALANWHISGQSPGLVFDEAVLAAGDADWDVANRPPDWLLGMTQLARRTSIYHSTDDSILWVSDGLNNDRRLGLSGPLGGDQPQPFTAPQFCLANCAGLPDPLSNAEVDYSHQYYRRVPQVRQHIAGSFAGAARARVEKVS
jgi:esterase/lipase superfamily enzyme